MEFLTLEQAAIRPYDVEYTYRLWPSASVLGVAITLTAVSAVATYRSWRTGAVGATFLTSCAIFALMIVGLLAYGDLRARLRPSNWLVRLQANGILLKYRSYLNALLPLQGRVAVFVPWSEIEWVRKHRVFRFDPTTWDAGKGTQKQNYVELKLRDGVNVKELDEHLADERRTPGPYTTKWYINHRSRKRHYPVSLTTDNLVRIEWNVAPSLAGFLAAISPFVAVGESTYSVVADRSAAVEGGRS
jgi:hypothetical protein